MKPRAYIHRNPFARYTLTRETVPQHRRKPCHYCSSRPGRFVYWIENDAIRRNEYPIDGTYCSIECMKAAADYNQD